MDHRLGPTPPLLPTQNKIVSFVVKIREGAEPFFIKKGKTGILCVHGFTSSAWDYREFGKYLADKGYTVSAPLIAGHGTTPEHLSITKGRDWLESVEKAFLDLKSKTNKIIVMGDSFGGNLALILAAKHDTTQSEIIRRALEVFEAKEDLKSLVISPRVKAELQRATEVVRKKIPRRRKVAEALSQPGIDIDDLRIIFEE